MVPLIKGGLDNGLDEDRASSGLIGGDPLELELREVVDGGLFIMWSSRARRASIQKLEAEVFPVVILVGDNVSESEAEVLFAIRLEGDNIMNETTL